ncbi:MAG: hypothetical protein PWP21_1521 [Thermosediminibacterales bacterium]|nr:hypothetical protein [Thermosediminibacterales bacterium]
MNLKTITITIIISLIIVGITPLIIPMTVTEPSQLNNLRFGAPLSFIQQDSSWLQPPEEWFPRKLIILSPWENPTRILWGNFAASVAIVSIGFTIISGVLTWIRGRSKL